MIATTASYQASFRGLAACGLGPGESAAVLRRSVELADAVRAEFGGDGCRRWVAASVGPYGAALADGSERGRYGLSIALIAQLARVVASPPSPTTTPPLGPAGRST